MWVARLLPQNGNPCFVKQILQVAGLFLNAGTMPGDRFSVQCSSDQS
jgi:hypothetical protein